jgi:hypothetical protein
LVEVIECDLILGLQSTRSYIQIKIRGMKIEVKTEHYKNSTCYLDQENCPLATAIKDVFSKKENTYIWVGGFTVKIDEQEYKIGVEWSGLVVQEIEANIKKAKQGKEIPTIIVNLKKQKAS